MTVALPTATSRLPMTLQRPTHPFRHPRSSAGFGVRTSSPWPGAVPQNIPPTGYSQPMMSRSPHFPATGHNQMTSDIKGHVGQSIMTSQGINDMKGPMGQPDIANQYVPNENLTPDQRQHREHSLANLLKIHQMLLADDSGNSVTDFKHINMAQDRQGPYAPHCCPSPNNLNSFGMNPAMAPPGPGYGSGAPLSPVCAPATPNAMESKPPPPYRMPASSTTAPAPKKASKKRKASAARSPASPIDPPIKSEKQCIPPSPLAAPSPSSGPVPLHHTQLPKAPQHAMMSEDMVGGIPKGMMQSLSRQHSMPNLPPVHGAPNPAAPYRIMQAGQPTPYQVSSFSSSHPIRVYLYLLTSVVVDFLFFFSGMLQYLQITAFKAWKTDLLYKNHFQSLL